MSNRRTAIVTGGSRGLGYALVHGLETSGWNVVTDARDGASLRAAVAGLDHVVGLPGDLTDTAHRAALVEAAVTLGGQVDLVVNNAGGLGPSPLPTLAAVPLDALAELFEVNVVAPLGLIQAVLPHLSPDALVVDITSDAAVVAYEGWGVYGATKAALDHIGRVFAVERPDLRVLTVDPGDLRTAMHQAAFPGEDISDRPRPETVVPAFLALIDGTERVGRHRLAEAS